MTPFAVVVTWADRSISAAEVTRLLDPIRSRCSDGSTALAVPGAAVAVGLRTTVAGETTADGLEVDWEERWLAVGDVRLYDRSALVAALGTVAPNQSDLSLVARAYRRFGDSILQRIVGDFGFVIWDWAERRVHAIRDHLGLRPVFYRSTTDGMSFATDVSQLMALAPDDRDVDPQMVLEYLLMRLARPGHTFFSRVKPILPAHRLVAGSDSLNQERYWTPSFARFVGTYDDAIEEWRHRFRTAVGDRLRSHRPIAAYLSGGFDSSSIVGAAHEVFEGGMADATRPLALSAFFPGFPCDERPYIEAVLERCTTFDSLTWDGREPNSGDFDEPKLFAPGLREGVGRGPRRENQAMWERDCRVVLKGHGGDALSWGYGALADLASRGRIATLLGELRTFGSWRRAARLLRIEVAMALPFKRSPSVPPWLGSDLREVFGRENRGGFERLGPSHVQNNTWDAIGGSMTSYFVDRAVHTGTDAGIEVRLPYLDVRLVELVLSIPWEFRMPRGDVRRLQRDGAAPFLPELVLRRARKVTFGVMLAHQLRVNLPRVQALLRDRHWASGRFVEQGAIVRILDGLLARDPTITRPGDWGYVWRIAVFEAWLRRFLGYDAPQTRVHE